MAVKHTYRVEVKDGYGWVSLYGYIDVSHDFAMGYLFGRQDTPSPRLAMRVVRSDDKVIDMREANDDVGIGMIVGFPTPEQYEDAAARALEKADRIRKMMAVREKRRAGERPCKACSKLTLGLTTNGMGKKTMEENSDYIEDDHLWVCPNCVGFIQ